MAKTQKSVGRESAQKKCLLSEGTPHILSWWGDTIGVEEKYMLGGGDTAHKLLMGGTIGVGTPHNIERTWFSALLSLQEGFPTDAVGEWFQLHFIATSWLHLASWNLLESQLSWEFKMEPSVTKEISDTDSTSHVQSHNLVLFVLQKNYRNTKMLAIQQHSTDLIGIL